MTSSTFREVSVPYKPFSTLPNARELARRHDMAFVSWRMPGDTEPSWMIGHFSTLDINEFKPPVFVKALFNNTLTAEGLDPVLAHWDNSLFSREDSQLSLDEILKEKSRPRYEKGHVRESTELTTKSQYMELCQKALDQIKNKKLEKVVLARARELTLGDGFDSAAYFTALCEQFPEAFVSIAHDPREDGPYGGVWINATPEVLMEVDEESFSTMALAGTTKHDGDGFSQKEQEEQSYVDYYIRRKLDEHQLSYRANHPEPQKAGHLMHLKSRYSIPNEQNWPSLLTSLHPTPAVCGYPADKALKFILEHEHFNRGYYAGFLGPILDEQWAAIYVNLRCMQIQGNKAYLYAGAGIVEDSVPEEEWEETEEKINTLFKHL